MRIDIDDLTNLNFDDAPVLLFAFDQEQKSLAIVLECACLITHPETTFDFVELEFFGWSSIEIQYHDHPTTEWRSVQVPSGCFIDKKTAMLGYSLSSITECPPCCSQLPKSHFHMSYIDETEVQNDRIVLRGVCDFDDMMGKWTEITIRGAQSHIHLESMLIVHPKPSIDNPIAIEIKRPKTSDAISEWFYQGKTVELNAIVSYLVNHRCMHDHSFDASKTCIMYSDLNSRGTKWLNQIQALAREYTMDSNRPSHEKTTLNGSLYLVLFILLILFVVWLMTLMYG